MNNTIKYISSIMLSSTLFISSCTDKFEDANTDTKSPLNVAPKYLLATAQTTLMNHNMKVDRQGNATAIQAQFLSESSYPSASIFKFNDGLENGYMNGYYNSALTLKKAQDLVDSDLGLSKEEKNGWALIIQTLKTFAFQNITDAFGPAMYTEALDLLNVTPGYDSQEVIYKDLLEKLYNVSSNVDTSISFNDSDMISQDIMYSGDLVKWQKFANSLLLRLAMRIADVEPTLSQEYFNKAVNENGGVFTSNEDNAIFQYKDAPNGSSWYQETTIDRFPNLVASNTIMDIQDASNDPRRDIYWRRPERGGLEFGKTTSSYWNYAYVSQNYAGYGTWNWGKADTPGVYMDYAEVQFFLSEAVVRGGYTVSGSAKDHYNNAIKASIEFQAGIVEWSQADIDIAVTDYLTEPTVNLDNASDKLKQIGREKWVALFFQGPEAWAEARRLDSPSMNIPEGESASDLPVRLLFSDREKIINSNNVANAITLLANGGDEYTTKLWWDVN
ncbi:SusD/RagB family nutrient-binding outer membrane lipoprotein [Tenacibaculum ovolyticum]|uniref:SusD/RagB family nutrient-binding outer membrane lipoprotein n=1 Tax=Tenacibaculum ovolyticum TaxID=104270 RepID=UPI003BAC894F